MRNKIQLIENLNRLLPLLNLALIIVLIFLTYLYILKREEVKERQEQNIVMLVIEDQAFKKLLENKHIQIFALSPLKLNVIDNQLYIEKDGRWDKVESGKVVIIYRESPPAEIKGVRE